MKVNKLLQLLRDNARNDSEGAPAIRTDSTDTEAHVYVYDVIDSMWGASAAALVAALAASGDKLVHLHINSPGGDVFEARAMASAIVAYPGKVVSHIDGVAASAATYLALAADEIRMTDGGLFMVHNSWTLAYGDKGELRQTADLLEKIDGQLLSDYAKRTGASLDQVKTWMEDETWFTPQEALDAKFIDAIDANTKRESTAQASARRWNMSAYANCPIKAEAKPRAIQNMTPPEAEYLIKMQAQQQAGKQMCEAFVVANPTSALREFSEECIEDCAGDLALIDLWMKSMPDDTEMSAKVTRQLQANRTRLIALHTR